MKNNFSKCSSLVALLFATSSHSAVFAQLITNNFDQLVGSTAAASGAVVPASAQLSNQLASASGVIFSSVGGAPYVGVVSVNFAPSGLNCIGGVATGNILSYSTPIQITFVSPTNSALPAVTDFVSIKNDLIPDSGDPVTMQAFGLDGTLLATTTLIDDHAFTLSVTNAGIHSVVITESDRVAYDDLVVDLPVIPASRQLITNNFDQLVGSGAAASGAVVPASAKLSNQLASVSGVIFGSVGGAPYVAVVSVNFAPSGLNCIGGVTTGNILSYSTPIQITFVSPNNSALPAVTDFVSIKNDLIPDSGAPVTMQAFGLDGTLLATSTLIDDHAFTLSVTNAGIHSVVITESDRVAYDDLVVDLPVLPPNNPASIQTSIKPAVGITWATALNHVYQVEWSSQINATVWQALGPSIAGNGTTNTIFDFADTGHRFYRIVTLK